MVVTNHVLPPRDVVLADAVGPPAGEDEPLAESNASNIVIRRCGSGNTLVTFSNVSSLLANIFAETSFLAAIENGFTCFEAVKCRANKTSPRALAASATVDSSGKQIGQCLKPGTRDGLR